MIVETSVTVVIPGSMVDTTSLRHERVSPWDWVGGMLRRMQVLELCIRGGKRETIHKGPLRVLRVGKEAGVRLEYFYVFNDVVSSDIQ